MKICRLCKKAKNESEFGPSKLSKDGLESRCRKCCNEKNKIYCAKNRERLAANQREIYRKDPQYIKAINDKWKAKPGNLEKVKRSQKEYSKTYKQNWIKRDLKRYYNVSPEQIAHRKEQQNNRCAICNDELIPGNTTHVDHDHKTGLVRGILCRACNHLLGNAKDNISTLQNAIRYLRLAPTGLELE